MLTLLRRNGFKNIKIFEGDTNEENRIEGFGDDGRRYGVRSGCFGTITPVHWAFMFMMQNLAIGAIVSLPIALIGKRNRY